MKKMIALVIAVTLLCFATLPTTSFGLDQTETTNFPFTIATNLSASDAIDYSIAPEHIYPFIFKGYSYELNQWSIDTSALVDNYLYIVDLRTDTVTQISHTTATEYTATNDFIVYVTTEQEIYISDYSGAEHYLLYSELQGQIDSLDYYNGKLSYIAGGNHVVVFDIATQTAQTVLTQDGLSYVYMLDNYNILLGDGTETPNYLNLNTQSVAPMSSYTPTVSLVPTLLPIAPEYELNAIAVNAANNVSFPLPDYPANIGSKATYSNFGPYMAPLSYFRQKGSNGNYTSNCQWYGGTYECDGFAKYAHDCYYHMADWSKTSYTWPSGDYITTVTEADENGNMITGYKQIRTEEAARTFFAGLSKGAFIRYGKDDDPDPANGRHSIIFDRIDGAGIWVYECNQAAGTYGHCAVFFQYYTFEKIACHYGWINYWVNHHISTAKTNYSADYHKMSCTTPGCNAFVLQEHLFSDSPNPECIHCGAIKYIGFG